MAFAFRRRPAWAAAAAGAGLVFVLADLTCYYASILLLLGLLALEREEAGVVTSLLAAATSAVPFLLRWEDDRYALVSALVLAAFALLLALLARDGRSCRRAYSARSAKTNRSTGAQPWVLISSPRQSAHCGRLPGVGLRHLVELERRVAREEPDDALGVPGARDAEVEAVVGRARTSSRRR